MADRWVEANGSIDLLALDLLTGIGVTIEEIGDGKERVYIEETSDTWAIGELIGRTAKGVNYCHLWRVRCRQDPTGKGHSKGHGVADWEYVLSPPLP